jgi:hypothetical protein
MTLRRKNRDEELKIDPKISIAMAGFQSPDPISKLSGRGLDEVMVGLDDAGTNNVLDAVVQATTQVGLDSGMQRLEGNEGKERLL